MCLPRLRPWSRATPRFPDVRMYTDMFNSEAMIKDDAAMRSQTRNAKDPKDLEYALAPLIFDSDSTHLASFGTASLWPIYGYPANKSRYIVCIFCAPCCLRAPRYAHLSLFLRAPLIDVLQLPDDFQDWYIDHYKKPATAEVLTFARREL